MSSTMPKIIHPIVDEFTDWFAFNKRTKGFDQHAIRGMLLCMYCVKKDIRFTVTTNRSTGRGVISFNEDVFNNDPVVIAFCKAFGQELHPGLTIEFFDFLNQQKEAIKEAYPDLIDMLLWLLVYEFRGYGMSDYIQPQDITDIVTHILNTHNCQSIFNPFAGLCSYSIIMSPETMVYAQELSMDAYALALIRLDAFQRENTVLKCEDSILCWPKERKFDAFVATPPLGFYLEGYKGFEDGNTTAEDFFFKNSSAEQCKKVSICITTGSFCFKKDSLEIRRQMVEDESLDMVIQLPKGVFYNSGVATEIVVRSFDSHKTSARFIDATKFVKNKKLHTLNAEEIISLIDNGDAREECKVIPYEVMREQEYSFIASHYVVDNSYDPDYEKVVIFRHFATLDRGVNMHAVKNASNVLNPADFKDNLLDAVTIKHVDKPSVERPRYLHKCVGPHVVVIVRDDKVRVYIHKDDTAFYTTIEQFAFKPENECRSLEYLAHYFLKNSQLIVQSLGGTVRPTFSAMGAILNQKVLIDINQVKIVNLRLQRERAAQSKILLAEEARIGFSQSIRDLAHMLGTPFSRQNDAIETLQSLDFDHSKEPWLTIESLIDTCQHINRMVTTFGQELDFNDLYVCPINMSDFCTRYLRAWSHYGRTKINVQLNDTTTGDIVVEADPDMLMVLFDTLLDNAYRHSFDKGQYKVDGGNVVCIDLQPVRYKESKFLHISFKNNGHELADGFTIDDYITKGRFNSETGRTGLGGYHVFSITKAYRGYMNLSSGPNWPFIVDILIPVSSSETSKFDVAYDDDCV